MSFFVNQRRLEECLRIFGDLLLQENEAPEKAYRNFKPYQLLERVTCYRLLKMNRVDQVEALANLRWLKVKNPWKKMDSAREAIEKDLRGRRYLEEFS